MSAQCLNEAFVFFCCPAPSHSSLTFSGAIFKIDLFNALVLLVDNRKVAVFHLLRSLITTYFLRNGFPVFPMFADCCNEAVILFLRNGSVVRRALRVNL